MITEEQRYAIGDEISEADLNRILDLIDEYVKLAEAVQCSVM